VTSIGSYAFYKCSNLSSVVFKNTSSWYYTTSSTATKGTKIFSSDLASSVTAAKYLTTTYYKYYWKVL
jgi:hypothetical protein